jgi:hypothetical protein
MSIGRKQRWAVLIALLGLTLSAAAWVSQEDEAAELVRDARPVPAQTIAPLARNKVEAATELKMNKLQRETKNEVAADLFEAKSWYVPPPPPKPLPPPPPSAPPLPFVYMGKTIEDGQLTVFLTKQERNYVVKAGDTLDGMYKVEEASPSMMTLIYLPLNIKQTLMIGGE